MKTARTMARASLAAGQKNEYDAPGSSDLDIEDFLTKIQFFPTPREIAAKILLLNQKLGDSMIEGELGVLSSDKTVPIVDELVEIEGNWLDTIINRVSSILFHQEDDFEHVDLSWEELVCLFQKTVSERIYDRMSLLSLSPHAKEGGTFSLKEELTEGIAEDIGLGLYRRIETRDDLRHEAQVALLSLAREFQRWLLENWSGVYASSWGEIRARIGEETEPKAVIVWLDPDVENEADEYSQAYESVGAFT